MQKEILPHLTPYEERLYGFLCSCRETYRYSIHYLARGTFYKSDKEIMKLHHKPHNTVRRGKRGLKSKGMIDFTVGRHRGIATEYKILTAEKPKTLKDLPFGEGVFQGTKSTQSKG